MPRCLAEASSRLRLVASVRSERQLGATLISWLGSIRPFCCPATGVGRLFGWMALAALAGVWSIERAATTAASAAKGRIRRIAPLQHRSARPPLHQALQAGQRPGVAKPDEDVPDGLGQHAHRSLLRLFDHHDSGAVAL